ncbi:MAG TPA: hypothetical protein VF868_12450 [Bacteroidia bacterium]|jgi:hypothetical protein
MNKLNHLRHFTLILLTIIATSCSKVADHNRFLTEHGITETGKIPAEYINGNGWKTLAGDYLYYMDLFTVNNEPQLLYIVANQKEKRMIALLHVNRFIMPAALAQGVKPATVVTNYEEMNPQDIAEANDMTEFNQLLKAMPEMKDFKWKNEIQNRIASGILLKTNFIYVTKSREDDALFSYSEKPVMQDRGKLVKEILSGEHLMYNRDVQRLNKSVEMSQFISLLGFSFEKTSNITHNDKKFFIEDLAMKDPIDFSGKGKMFFFYPFKSFVRTHTKGETPGYFPAIETYQYTYTSDTEGFPVFSRNTQFVSLLERKPTTL